MKILYLNPVMTSKYDKLFERTLSAIKDPSTELHITSFCAEKNHVHSIEYSCTEQVVAPDIVRASAIAASEGFDAMVIGCFYDTALAAAREVSGEMFVIGPCQASVNIAMTLANTFSIVIGQIISSKRIKENLRHYGAFENLMSIECTEQTVSDFQKNTSETAQFLFSCSQQAIKLYRAECIILGCTLEAEFYAALTKELGVPVIDASIAALKTAEKMAQLKQLGVLSPSRKYTSQPPPTNVMAEGNLSANSSIFGNRIVIPANTAPASSLKIASVIQ